MIVKTAAELDALKEIGYICALTLKKMGEAVQSGISTAELDSIGREILRSHGARSAPIVSYQFPGYNCISVNEVVAHGIPSPTLILKEGDNVNIDVSACKNGFFSDNGATYAVGQVSAIKQKVIDCSKRALQKAIAVAVAGNPISFIGREAEAEAHRSSLFVIKNLTGHGVGHALHDKPDSIYNFYNKRDKRLLQAGMVLAIEPFISERDEFVLDAAADGWTLRTAHNSIVAQFEHSIVVTENEPIILTITD